MPTWPLGSGHHEDEDVRKSENEGFGQEAGPYHGEEQGHEVRVTEVRETELRNDDDLRDSNVVDTDARDANLQDSNLQDVDAQDRYPQGQDVPVASSPAQTTDDFPAQNTPIQDDRVDDNRVEDTRVDDIPAQDTPVQDTPVTNRPSEVGQSLLEPDFADTFQQRWREIQASFVDDPHETVREADQLADEVVNKLTTALTDRKHSLDERWQADKENTEELRLALRGYRELLDRLIKL
jgi:hypothetical protein